MRTKTFLLAFLASLASLASLCAFGSDFLYTTPETYSTDPGPAVQNMVRQFNHREFEQIGSFSQTTGTPPAITNVTGSGFLPQWLVVGYDYVAQDIPFLTNGVAEPFFGFGENTSKATQKSSGKWIELMGVLIPVYGSIGVGAGLMHEGSAWSEGSISVTFSVTNTIQYLGQFKSGVASGPAYDFHTRSYTDFSFAFTEKEFDLYKNEWLLKIGFLTGDIADRPGVDMMGYTAVQAYW